MQHATCLPSRPLGRHASTIQEWAVTLCKQGHGGTALTASGLLEGAAAGAGHICIVARKPVDGWPCGPVLPCDEVSGSHQSALHKALPLTSQCAAAQPTDNTIENDHSLVITRSLSGHNGRHSPACNPHARTLSSNRLTPPSSKPNLRAVLLTTRPMHIARILTKKGRTESEKVRRVQRDRKVTKPAHLARAPNTALPLHHFPLKPAHLQALLRLHTQPR